MFLTAIFPTLWPGFAPSSPYFRINSEGNNANSNPVSDIGMPVEDGYDFIKKVRKPRSKRAREIPAIALTAYATDEDRALALSAGFQIHLPKPIEPEALLKSVAAALGRPM